MQKEKAKGSFPNQLNMKWNYQQMATFSFRIIHQERTYLQLSSNRLTEYWVHYSTSLNSHPSLSLAFNEQAISKEHIIWLTYFASQLGRQE